MCNFFSFITHKGVKFYFNDEQRKTEVDSDSHSQIAQFFLGSTIKEDRCNKYEWVAGKLVRDQINDPEEQVDDVRDWATQFTSTRQFAFMAIRACLAGKAQLEDIPESYRERAERILHEHACYSAESCLERYEKQYPGDSRVRDAIEAKRKWLRKEIGDEELMAAIVAAWSAARSAARSAAESAAWSAARSAAESARSAAWGAAWSAAESAEIVECSAAESARSAAWGAAWSVQQELLTKMMEEAFPV